MPNDRRPVMSLCFFLRKNMEVITMTVNKTKKLKTPCFVWIF